MGWMPAAYWMTSLDDSAFLGSSKFHPIQPNLMDLVDSSIMNISVIFTQLQ